MAKWTIDADNHKERFFFGMYDTVPYLIPMKNRDQWEAWIGSNSPDIPAYAAPYSGPFETSFEAPQAFTMYDTVPYLSWMKNRDQWEACIGSNSPDISAYSGPFETSFEAPQAFTQKLPPHIEAALARLAQW